MISKISKVHFLIFTSMVDPGIVWLSNCDKNLIEDKFAYNIRLEN